MVRDGTLDKDKLSFSVIEADEYGGVSITNVHDGSGNSFGIEYTNFKQNAEAAIDSLSYRLEIEAPNGKNLRGGNITLNARLYKNSVDVTDNFDVSCFKWKRHSLDNYGDQYWNEAHNVGAKSITLTGNDVRIEADFECCFEANGVTVSSLSGGE